MPAKNTPIETLMADTGTASQVNELANAMADCLQKQFDQSVLKKKIREIAKGIQLNPKDLNRMAKDIFDPDGKKERLGDCEAGVFVHSIGVKEAEEELARKNEKYKEKITEEEKKATAAHLAKMNAEAKAAQKKAEKAVQKAKEGAAKNVTPIKQAA